MHWLATALLLALATAQEPARPAPAAAPAPPAAAPGTPAAAPAHVEIPTIAARPEDVATVESIVEATYEAISGPAGQPRQWARDRALYVPGVLLTATGVRRSKDGQIRPFGQVMDYQTYVNRVDPGFVFGEATGPKAARI